MKLLVNLQMIHVYVKVVRTPVTLDQNPLENDQPINYLTQ